MYDVYYKVHPLVRAYHPDRAGKHYPAVIHDDDDGAWMEAQFPLPHHFCSACAKCNDDDDDDNVGALCDGACRGEGDQKTVDCTVATKRRCSNCNCN